MMRDERIVGLEAQLNTRAAEIEHLKLTIAKLRRIQVDRKSKLLDHKTEQLELQLEDLQADEAEVAREMPAVDQAPRKKSVRKPLRSTCHTMKKCMRRQAMPARPAAVVCVGSERTWRSSTNTYHPACARSGKRILNWPVAVAA